MKTVEQFAKLNDVKKSETVIGWCEKGYIPGAVQKENELGKLCWMIPDHAMVPYYRCRYKPGTSPYYSMVNACLKQKHIVAALYQMDESRFQSYIDNLIAAGFITSYWDKDGIVHYTETWEGTEAVKAGRLKFEKSLNAALKAMEVIVTATAAIRGI